MSEITPIKINLEELENNAPLPESQIIYQDVFTELKRQIIRKTEINVRKMTNTDKMTLVHQPCYFINGERGSGKSTFLRSLQNALCGEGAVELKMALLARIDPTELADTENFFIHILGHVHKRLKGIQRLLVYDEKAKPELKHAYESLRTMSRGLGLLAKQPENVENVLDADYFVQNSISECVSGVQLKENFAELVDILCKLLGVSALLVTVDDGDMNFNKCSEVFETIRKYLLTPRMVYVFAGDQKLYSMVIRGMQMRHFGKLSLEHDVGRKKQIFHLLDHLEEQYIMKLFPMQNRVTLTGGEGILAKNPLIEYGDMWRNEQMNIKSYIRDKLPEMGIVYDTSTVLEFMSQLSIRSSLQLLAYWVCNIQPGKTKEENMRHFCDGICTVVSHALIKHGVDVNAIRGVRRYGMWYALIQHVKNLKQGMMGVKMLPGMGADLLPMVSFCLSAEFSRMVRSLPDILSGVLNIFPYFLRYGGKAALSGKLFHHLNADSEWSRGAECTSIMLELNMQNGQAKRYFGYGVIPLFPYEHVGVNSGIRRISFDEFMLQLMEAVISTPTAENIIYFLAVYHTLSRCEIDKSRVFCLSVYNMIHTVRRLLDQCRADSEELVKEILFEQKHISVDIRDEEKTRTIAPKIFENERLKSLDKKELDVEDFVQELRRLEACKEVVDKVMEWISMSGELRYNTASLYRCWDVFMGRSEEVTSLTRVFSLKEEDLVRADSLLLHYLYAFENGVFDSLVEENELEELPITSCPLCLGFVNAPKALAHLLQKVNIAPVDLRFDVEYFYGVITNRVEALKRRLIRVITDAFVGLTDSRLKKFAQCWNRLVEAARCRILNENVMPLAQGKGVTIKRTRASREMQAKKFVSVSKENGNLFMSNLRKNFGEIEKQFNNEFNASINGEMEKIIESLKRDVAESESLNEALTMLTKMMPDDESLRLRYTETFVDVMEERLETELRSMEKKAAALIEDSLLRIKQ